MCQEAPSLAIDSSPPPKWTQGSRCRIAPSEHHDAAKNFGEHFRGDGNLHHAWATKAWRTRTLPDAITQRGPTGKGPLTKACYNQVLPSRWFTYWALIEGLALIVTGKHNSKAQHKNESTNTQQWVDGVKPYRNGHMLRWEGSNGRRGYTYRVTLPPKLETWHRMT